MDIPWFGETALGGSARLLRVARNLDGRLELFYSGTDDYLYRNRQSAPGSAVWEGETAFPGDRATALDVARNASGALEIVYIGENGNLYHNRQTAPNGSTWTGETRFPNLTNASLRANAVRVLANRDGRLELFYRALVNVNGSGVFHFWQDAPDGTNWLGQTEISGNVFAFVIGSNQNGLLEMIATRDGSNMERLRQTTPNGESWSDPVAFSGQKAIDLAVALNANGELEAFYVGTNTDLYHSRQVGANSVTWTPETSFNGAKAKRVVVTPNADGRLEMFYTGTGNHLYHNWQTVPGGNGWAGETAFPGDSALAIAVARNLDGRLELFYIGTNHKLYHNWQTVVPPHRGPRPR